jgi:hypothetical protein
MIGYTASEDGTDRMFGNVGIQNSDAGGITQNKAYRYFKR